MNDQEWLDEQLKDIANKGKRIDIQPVELKYEKPISCKEFYLELHDDHIKYGYDFVAQVTIIQEDDESGWMEQRRFCNAVFKKEKISGVDFYRYTREEKFQVVLYIAGCSYDPTLYFTKESEARKAYDIIREWWQQKAQITPG